MISGTYFLHNNPSRSRGVIAITYDRRRLPGCLKNDYFQNKKITYKFFCFLVKIYNNKKDLTKMQKYINSHPSSKRFSIILGGSNDRGLILTDLEE